MINADAGVNEEGEADSQEQDAGEAERLGAGGEEGNDQRRHPEIIGVALLQAERAGRVAEPLEDVRKQDRRERDRENDGADQHAYTYWIGLGTLLPLARH